MAAKPKLKKRKAKPAAKPKPPGRPAFEPTDQNRGEVKALRVAGYTQEQIADYLDIDEKTLRLHFRDEIDKAKMKVIAGAAGNVVRAALGAPAQFDNKGNEIRAEQKPEAWAICFLLKTQAKDQGWSERFEHTGKGGGPIEHADLSKLTPEELDEAERLARKIADSGANRGGTRPTQH
jgi:hypothetical protein